MNLFGVPAEAWFPVLTLFLGALLKGAFDSISDSRTAKREREARRDQRTDAIRLQRNTFQRGTLLELQEAISSLARMTGRGHIADTAAFRNTGTWQKQLLPDDISNGFLHAQTNVMRLRVRARDAEVRALADQFTSGCVEAMYSKSEAASIAALSNMTEVLARLNDRIGEAMRALDEDEATSSPSSNLLA